MESQQTSYIRYQTFRYQKKENRPLFRFGLALLGVVFLLFLPLLSMAQGLTVSDVGKELACLCGCGLTIESCTHGNCGFAEPAKLEIKQMIEQGRTKGEIIQAFVSRYGERVLAAPTKKGFNLSAWVMPFLAIMAGGILIYFLVHAWVRRREETLAMERHRMARVEIDPKYQERLEKELRSFD